MPTATGDVRLRANGSRGDLYDTHRGMDVHYGLNGGRQVAVERPDHSRIVAEPGGRGYVQRPFVYGGHEFAQRTYVSNGRVYSNVYWRYPYHGVYLESYAPPVYYAPTFYRWAFIRWALPVHYTWGFVDAPWYGYYGGYFTPYPVYPSAAFWLTDYMVAQSLAASYQAQAAYQPPPPPGAPGPGPDGPPPNYAPAPNYPPAPNYAPAPSSAPTTADGALTPEVKQLIAAEVQQEIALESQGAQLAAQHRDPDPAATGIPHILADRRPHVFVAGNNVDAVEVNSAECSINEGDAVQSSGVPPAPDATNTVVVVLSSHKAVVTFLNQTFEVEGCRKGASVVVAFDDLQEMQNYLRQSIGQGMQELQANQAKGGFPPLPPGAQTPVKADYIAAAPPPDQTAAAQVNQQWQEANRAEQEAGGASQPAPTGSAGQNPPAAAPTAPPAAPPAPEAAPAAPAAAPKTIEIGQTIDQVTAILGAPKTVVNLGAKKIYVYPDMKVTFVGGKVRDVQ